MEKQYKKLVKYLNGTAEALKELAKEIDEDKTLTKESEDLMSRIGFNLLFNAKTFTFLDK